MDPKVNGQVQKDWGWLIAAYLFLGGVGSGAYVIGAVNAFLFGSGDNLSTIVGLWVSWPALLIGSICLLADLGSPAKAVLSGLKPGTSWIARGFWIISLFMVIAFVHTMLLTFTETKGDGTYPLLAGVGILFAVGTMAYTGILLGTSKGIPFWRTGAVPVVFVISALVTGHFTVMLGVVIFGGSSETGVLVLDKMALEAAILVAVEVLAILFFLQAAFRTPDSRESALRILRQITFVVGYILGGLVAPLVLMLLLHYGMKDAGAGGFRTVSALGALLGLVGGLLLRHGVLISGTLPTWNIGGFQFRRIAKPKEPKPGIGLLPPH